MAPFSTKRKQMEDSYPSSRDMQQSDVNKEVKKEESCRSCLYTGVATCAGLSAYFLHLAYEEDQPPSKTHQRQPDATTSKSATIRKANTPKQPTTGLRTAAMKLMRQKSASNRSFHLAFSAAWAVAGLYRLYLN
jgi:hypothetical protein